MKNCNMWSINEIAKINQLPPQYPCPTRKL